MKSLFAFAALTILSASTALAELPAGHRPIPAGTEMQQAPKDIPDSQLPQKGEVLSSVNTDQYTYIEVLQAPEKESLWIASTLMTVKKGDQLRFEDGVMMTNYKSKTLNRTFPKVLFVGRVAVIK